MDAAYTSSIIVTNHPGMDAPCAALFARTASRFDADLTVCFGGQKANAKSILGLLSLCVRQGDTIRVVGRGEDAAAALEALESLFSVTGHAVVTSGPLLEWPVPREKQRSSEKRAAI